MCEGCLPRGRVESWLSLRLREVSSAACENTPSGILLMELCSMDKDCEREE